MGTPAVSPPLKPAMPPMTPKRARQRYVRSFGSSISAYVVLVFGVPLLLRQYEITGPLLWLLAVLPALPLLFIIYVLGRYLLETDEYERAIQTRRMMAALGAMLAVCTVYGFMETFAAAPHLELFLVFPMFCVFWGLSCIFIRTAK
ncbi:MAG: hypothetical protein IV086_13540 [Hyphomonadaceae bacterium]|nr:MAG: hypothetical protein FD160_1928 [Caulobacteraceae bacterium]MBT9446718.1 hypothetical protein [Hyphomonadaceae bacterium]TPW06773.1 MAG: hypothetical protein FD124_1573 [Alphaproteobacteria bacterium]